MTEKLSIDERIKIFDENFADISARVAAAARKSGRNPEDITLLAATKTVPTEVINHAVEKGIKVIGENRVQEFLEKEENLLPSKRHLIGHLQTNKVKYIIGKVDMIESVDSLKLAEEISKQSVKRGIVTDILIEVNIGDEQSKSGVSYGETETLVKNAAKLAGIKVRGLMAIPPICEKSDELCGFFSKMYNLFIDIRGKNIDNSSMEYLSMGMSGDYELAIENGANAVRIGSALFGKRNYF